MEIEPKELSKWLKSNLKWNRDSFCKRLNISKKTLYNWTSGSVPVPEKHRAQVIAIMSGKDVRVFADTFQITVDEERYIAYEKAAKEKGMSIREWFVYLMDKAVKESKFTYPNPYSDDTVIHN